MPPNTTFGKRTRPTAPPLAAPSRPMATRETGTTPDIPARADQDELPFLTMGLITVLAAIFWIEVSRGGEGTGWLSVGIPALIGFGGSSGQLVWGAHQWWRVFTAPMLHGGLWHLTGNCVALFFAGRYLEPVIGIRWFGALFAISAIAGSLASLGQNASITVSVGASGAITGLLAATLLCSYRMEDAKNRGKMQIIAARILVPAVLPAYLPGHLGNHVDYAAHVGGAVAGFAVAAFLVVIWDRQTRRPHMPSLATAIAGIAAIATACGFLFAAGQDGSVQAAATPSGMIPQSEIPAQDADGIERSANLVARYPHDPRAHYFRARYFSNQNDIPQTAEELRTAIALSEAQKGVFKPEYADSLKMMLALTIRAEGDLEAARDMAREPCSNAGAGSPLVQMLRSKKICD
jgi:rhomboid protease GluP